MNPFDTIDRCTASVDRWIGRSSSRFTFVFAVCFAAGFVVFILVIGGICALLGGDDPKDVRCGPGTVAVEHEDWHPSTKTTERWTVCEVR